VKRSEVGQIWRKMKGYYNATRRGCGTSLPSSQYRGTCRRYVLCNVELFQSGSSETIRYPCNDVCTNDVRRDSALTLSKEAIRLAGVATGEAVLWYEAIAPRTAA